MFCHKCGTQIAEGAAFCHRCGAKVVHEDITLPIPDNKAEIVSKANISAIKTAKLIGAVLVVITMIVLIASGVLKNVFDCLIDVNREIENSATGATTVSGMQSAVDLFPTESNGDKTTITEPSESSFAWVEEAHMVIESSEFGDRYIVGAIQNISDISFTSASVEFILYDSDGNQIDTAHDSISNFMAGNIWRFKATVWTNDAAYFEFLHATKTYP